MTISEIDSENQRKACCRDCGYSTPVKKNKEQMLITKFESKGW